MNKCPKCKHIFDDTWKICLSCGLELLDESLVNGEPEISPSRHGALTTTEQTIAREGFILFGLFIFFFIGIFIADKTTPLFVVVFLSALISTVLYLLYAFPRFIIYCNKKSACEKTENNIHSELINTKEKIGRTHNPILVWVGIICGFLILVLFVVLIYFVGI